eukprot:6212797-Pleurochrysis_carterae.AAC.2
MNCFYGLRVYSVNSKAYSLAIRPERAIITVSMRFNNDSYRSNRGQGWEPQLLARLDRNSSLALPIESTSTVDRLAIDLHMKLGLLDQFANLYYTPSDWLSTHDAHLDGFAPHSLMSLMTFEYESPAFDYSKWPMLHPAP